MKPDTINVFVPPEVEAIAIILISSGKWYRIVWCVESVWVIAHLPAAPTSLEPKVGGVLDCVCIRWRIGVIPNFLVDVHIAVVVVLVRTLLW